MYIYYVNEHDVGFGEIWPVDSCIGPHVWCSRCSASCKTCMLQCVAMCCSVLQCVAVCSAGAVPRVLQCVVVCLNVLQCVTVCCSVFSRRSASCHTWMMQCVAVCCSALQCVAVCGNVLQCGAVREPRWCIYECALYITLVHRHSATHCYIQRHTVTRNTTQHHTAPLKFADEVTYMHSHTAPHCNTQLTHMHSHTASHCNTQHTSNARCRLLICIKALPV